MKGRIMGNGNLEEARTYLAGNAELREALGVAPDADLQVEPLGKGEHNENYVFWPLTAAAPEEDRAVTTDALADPAAPVPGTSPTRFVLRVNRIPQPFHTDQVAYEFAALKALEESGCTPRPLYLDHSPASLGKGVLVESFCSGQELDFDRLRPNDLERAAQLMANIHAVPVPVDCPLYTPADPLQSLFQECVDRFKAYAGTALEDPRYTRWIQRFMATTQDSISTAPAPAEADRSHIINTETLASHFLLPCDSDAAFNPESPGTFVDWERPIVAEPAQDLAFFVAPSTTFWDSDYLFPREGIGAFLDRYWLAVDGRFPQGTFARRFNAYLQVSVLRSQTWFCKNAARYAASSSTGEHTVERTFRKWGIYTSDDFNEMLWQECFN